MLIWPRKFKRAHYQRGSPAGPGSPKQMNSVAAKLNGINGELWFGKAVGIRAAVFNPGIVSAHLMHGIEEVWELPNGERAKLRFFASNN